MKWNGERKKTEMLFARHVSSMRGCWPFSLWEIYYAEDMIRGENLPLLRS
jgi:hypothetical protein